MRLLLVNVGRKSEIRLPQGLFYLASAVHAAGHKVTIHDESLAADSQRSLEEILTSDADIIGLSVYTLPWQLKRVEEISRAVKKVRRSTLVMWGGWHPTLYPRHTILNENVDIVVRGPGEKPVCELLDALEEGRSLRNVSGLVIRENGEVLETGAECLDPEYLYPHLNLELVDFDTYLRRHDRGEGILQYITSRGCHGKCRFCVMSRLFKGCLMRKPRNQIVSELREVFRKFKIRAIHFSDDNTFRNDAEALELCAIVRSVTAGKGMRWRCATRIDTVSRLSKQTYKELAASGCEGVVVGIESGVDRVLRLMGKGITVAQIYQALKSLEDNGLSNNLFSFLFGFTGETKKEAGETLRLVRKTRLMCPGSDITLHVYFPGASDARWLALSSIPPALKSRLSEIFANYYAEHITSYRVAGAAMRVLRYYFGASRRRRDGQAGIRRFLRRLRRRIVLFRVKYGVFVLPFEYHLANLPARTVRKPLECAESGGKSCDVKKRGLIKVVK